ncbi:hypothetical protein HDU83_007024 [Entophlyctis luteolus]|nr:hypothetical protein HDU83_007024 [Entophlyctis luteolus]
MSTVRLPEETAPASEWIVAIVEAAAGVIADIFAKRESDVDRYRFAEDLMPSIPPRVLRSPLFQLRLAMIQRKIELALELAQSPVGSSFMNVQWMNDKEASSLIFKLLQQSPNQEHLAKFTELFEDDPLFWADLMGQIRGLSPQKEDALLSCWKRAVEQDQISYLEYGVRAIQETKAKYSMMAFFRGESSPRTVYVPNTKIVKVPTRTREFDVYCLIFAVTSYPENISTSTGALFLVKKFRELTSCTGKMDVTLLEKGLLKFREFRRLVNLFTNTGFAKFFQIREYPMSGEPEQWKNWLSTVGQRGARNTGNEEFGIRGLQCARALASLFIPGYVQDSQVSRLQSIYQESLIMKKTLRATDNTQRRSFIKPSLPSMESSPELLKLQAELNNLRDQLSSAKSRKAAQAMKIQSIREYQIPRIRSLMAQLYGTVQPMDSATVSGTHDKAVAKMQTFVRLTKKMPMFYTARLAEAACELGRTVANKRLSMAIEAAYFPLSGQPPETVNQFFKGFIRVNLESFADNIIKQLPSPLANNEEAFNFKIPWMDELEIPVDSECVESLKTQLCYIQPSIEKYSSNSRVPNILGKSVEDYIRVGFQMAVCQNSLSLLTKPVEGCCDPSYARDDKFDSADKLHVANAIAQAPNFVVIPGLVEGNNGVVSKCHAMAKTLE